MSATMRFKLHECVDIRLARLFEDAGHDAEQFLVRKWQERPTKHYMTSGAW